jgi:ribosome maturation factor RimP
MGLWPIFCLWRAIYMDLNHLLDVTVSGLGYELVECERSGKSGLLRVFVDKAGGISIDDCARISQHLSHVLTVEGVDYGRLEVSSPGLDRALRKEGEFARFAGEKIRVKLRVALNGQRNFMGTLRGAHNGKLELEADGNLLVIELGNLDKARLVPNI